MTLMCSWPIFNRDQYFAYLVFVKRFKPTKYLKTGELNKLVYIYLECYEAFKVIWNYVYGVITTMKIQN